MPSTVPTNIITGFLGVGKTTAIFHLLEQKPRDQRWAVLVNEFGEIGVDGSLFQGRHAQSDGVFIREVPGGCMCCAAGLPMQIALTQLLRKAKPDRLLIEPTGLGHPIEVLEILAGEYYRDYLSIQKILTLVDARKLKDNRYTEHDTFLQQIAIGDVIVGNKQDLYAPGDAERLEAFVQQQDLAEVEVVFAQQGELPLQLLDGATGATSRPHAHLHNQVLRENMAEVPLPASGYLTAINKGEGYQSIGWRFSPSKVFVRSSLFAFLSGLGVERMKAVFITEEGIFGYNLTADTLTEIELDDCLESRIEIIATEVEEAWESRLLACLENPD